ncbi:hypothetical protein ACQQ2Q_10470 [Agrobacterium sp. ES01]|uniref:hypothetical protein n=1 Tax=Agrobacterium sp. ES01 TaxID=3420714 RepID=UPI003D0C334B
MTLRFLLPLSLLFPIAAFAGDMTPPVKTVMDITADNWSEDGGEGRDIFADDLLNSIYSKAFVAEYRAAAKYPVFDDSTTPFDYDVILNAQDGCALEDLSISQGQTSDGVTDVVARFNNTKCFGDAPENLRVEEVHFDVIDEDGHAVIDDIHPPSDGNLQGSVRADMQLIAAQ